MCHRSTVHISDVDPDPVGTGPEPKFLNRSAPGLEKLLRIQQSPDIKICSINNYCKNVVDFALKICELFRYPTVPSFRVASDPD